ncbi:hypothetical protein N431DRAFT_426528 [Stipitochalara longipes BDJ]|nr:hypothetical protein N431DRAFT_426528 [Stipitochalara longipes BDJ]
MNALSAATTSIPGSPRIQKNSSPSSPVQNTSSPAVHTTQKDASSPANGNPRIAPRRLSISSYNYHPAQATELATQALNSLQNFLPLIIGITIFGASTFASLVSQLDEPVCRFSLATVRTFMAIAWILFIVALGVAMFGVAIIKPGPTGSIRKPSLEFLVKAARVVKMFCQLLVIAAFLFLSLVVVAYAGPVGWAAVGLTVVGGWITLGFWMEWVMRPAFKDPLACD